MSRSFVVLLTLAVASPLAAQDMASLCREERHYANGQWASYIMVTGGDRPDTIRTRSAIVGVEGTGADQHLWYEISSSSSRRPRDGQVIIQVLMSGLATLEPRAHAMVMKSGDRPAQRMPDQMVAMMSGRMGQNMASEMAKQCERSEIVGTESVTVPAGTFRALHIRSDKTESWMSRQIPFYMVRVQLENGGTMELTGHGRDAKSLITETPQQMGGPSPRP